MFFSFPVLALLPSLIYLAAALLPAFILLRYVYKQDTIEKEPVGLLLSLLVMGCLSALCAGVLEGIAVYFLDSFVSPESPIYVVLLAFLVVAVAEEGMKLFFLKRRSWRHPAFNYRFDGVVYAVFVSLGFAALENVQYVVNYGLSVALPRAMLAIPGHLSFSIFMGIYYGRARLLENLGDHAGAKRCLRAGFLIAVFLHGFYDTCAMLGTGLSVVVFLIFVVIMFVNAHRALKRESATDEPITVYESDVLPPFDR